MLIAHAATHEVQSIRLALMLLALAIVIFWRMAVRVLFAVLIIATVVGALVLLQGLH